MLESAREFLDFLGSMDLRVFQERRIGLDVYNSGLWGILPVALAIVSATVFFLAIFQVIPRRRHSVLLLLASGVLAALIGLGGTYFQYRSYSSSRTKEGRDPPRVLLEGKGVDPAARPGYSEALLSLPFLLGGTTLAGDLAGVIFLLIYGGAEGSLKKRGPSSRR